MQARKNQMITGSAILLKRSNALSHSRMDEGKEYE